MNTYIYFFAVVSGLILSKSRIMYTINFLYLWILIGWNSGNPDYETYRIVYESYKYNNYTHSTFEVGFQFLMRFFSRMGLSYQQFLIIVSLMCLCLISTVILKFSNRPTGVLSLYLLFPFLLDVVQIRSFIASSVVLYSFHYLNKENKNNKYIYTILIVLATLMHYSTIFYFLFCIIFFVDSKTIRKYSLIFFPISILFQGIIFRFVNIFIPSDITGRYSDGLNISYITLFMYIIYLFIIILLLQYSKANKGNDEDIKISNDEQDIIIDINYLMLFIVPFIMSSLEYFRIQRGIMILNYIVILSILGKKKIKIRNLFMITFIYLFIFSAFLFFIYINLREGVFIEVLENNYVINWIFNY